MNRVLTDLYDIGYRGFLSLELFNKEHATMDALSVAREGLAKMKTAVQTALVGRN